MQNSMKAESLARRAIDLLPSHEGSVYEATAAVIEEVRRTHDLDDDQAAHVYGQVLGKVIELRKHGHRPELTSEPAPSRERLGPPTTFSAHAARAMAKIEDDAPVIPDPTPAEPPLSIVLFRVEEQLQLFPI